ncbi:hypothetical protein ES288_A03G197600v1 [Gossypium darwinii]|uniref:Uncharacterized protein n=1 Tax=Gossypium darwinii TaxID=34276 RepID=A0A5D2H8A8_GOSDA|nr:hypothetical protein ES288_A03G197600v1 [Gossypium darwinii]
MAKSQVAYSSLDDCFLALRSPLSFDFNKAKGNSWHSRKVCMAWRGGYARMEASARGNGGWGLCRSCWCMLQH